MNKTQARQHRRNKTRQAKSRRSWATFFVVNFISIGGLVFLHQSGELEFLMEHIREAFRQAGIIQEVN